MSDINSRPEAVRPTTDRKDFYQSLEDYRKLKRKEKSGDFLTLVGLGTMLTGMWPAGAALTYLGYKKAKKAREGLGY